MNYAVKFVALAAMLVCVPSASAVTLVNPDRSPATFHQKWADRAPIPMPHSTVILSTDVRKECGGPRVMGCAGGTPELNVSVIAMFALRCRECRATLFHELGHIYDEEMPQWKRDRFLQIANRVGRKWVDPSVTFWQQEPREMFAQAFSYCALGQDRKHDRRSKHGFRTSWRTLRKVCDLIREPYEPILEKPAPPPSIIDPKPSKEVEQ